VGLDISKRKREYLFGKLLGVLFVLLVILDNWLLRYKVERSYISSWMR